MSNDYTNPNTNPKTLTAGILTLTYPDGAFESFCAPAFCDFIRNYSRTELCPLVTSYILLHMVSFVITNMPEILCCKYAITSTASLHISSTASLHISYITRNCELPMLNVRLDNDEHCLIH